ncbi:PEP-utilizing enzyme [Blastococcus sp. SYSU D00820]
MADDQLDMEHWITDWEVSKRYPVYTRANAGEVLPDPSSPLNVTMVWNKGLNIGWREGYTRTLGTHLPEELDETMPETIGNFAGYHYTNFSITELIGARLPGMTVPIWNSLWVGTHPDLPEYVEKPGDQVESLTENLAQKSAWALSTTTFPEVEETKRRARRARESRPDLSALSDAELVARSRELVDDLVYGYSYHVPTTTLSTVGPAVAGQLLAEIGEADQLGALMSGLGDVDSAAPSFVMWDLGRLVRGSATLTALFDEGMSGLLDRLRASDDPDAQRFVQLFDGLVFEYGSRAPNEWDLRSDSWETQPVLLLVAIDGMRRSDESADPARVRDENRIKREKLTAELADRMPTEEARQSFLAACSSITRFMPWRERTKTSCVRSMNEIRVAMYELGRRMVERGVLADHHDITMLREEELDAFVADPESFREELATRARNYQLLFDLDPPFFLTENKPLSEWPRRTGRRVEQALPGAVLTGVGGSPGTARGRARIITDPYDVGDYQPGDVLIAPQTDPAWTPLFVPAAAVVVNVGATITHAVIVCRELGLPCAVSVQDATLRIPDGAMVEVDGTAGTVTVL